MEYYFDENLAKDNEQQEIINEYKKVISICMMGTGIIDYQAEQYYITYLLFLLKKYNSKIFKELSNSKDALTDKNTKRLSFFEIIYIELTTNCNLTETETNLVNEIFKRLNETIIRYNLIEQNFYKNIVQLNDVFEKMDIEIFKDILKEPVRLSISQFEIPNEVNSLISDLLRVRENENVLLDTIGFGSSVDQFLWHDCNITEKNINNEASLLNKIRVTATFNGDNIPNIIHDNKDNDDKKYDKIFCNYPLGIKIDKIKMNNIIFNHPFIKSLSSLPSISSDWFFIDESLKRLSKDGKLIVLMPNGPLFKIADKEIKKELVSRGLIEEIIALPEKIFGGTSIQLNIIVFSSNNDHIKMIDASELYREINKTRILNTGLIVNLNSHNKEMKIISINDIDDDYNLLVKNYTSDNEIKLFNPHQLSEYVNDCFRGFKIGLKDYYDANGEYEILNVSDLEDGMISNNLTRLNPQGIAVDRYLLKENDVVISSHGIVKVGVIKNIGERKIIASGNFTVVRLNIEKLKPFYLEAFLNSSNGKKILRKASTGATTYIFTPGKILTIEIPILDIEKQNKLMKEYENKKTEIMLTKAHLHQLQDQLLNFFDNNTKEEF